MPIDHKHKCIFIHIPKTAGTSIEKSLGIKKWDPSLLRLRKEFLIDGVLYAPQHLTAVMVRGNKKAKKWWKDYFKFSIVRHPYTRVLSEFCWVNRHRGPNFKFTRVGFNKHLKHYYKALDKDHKLSQYSYLHDDDGNLMVDYVAKFENLQEEFRFLKKKLHIQTNLPTIHKSRNSEIMLKSLKQGQKNIIYSLYQKDFETFGYDR